MTMSQDRSTDDTPRRLFQRHVHDLSMSSHSLTISPRNDLPTPTHAVLPTSSQSTPMTSPSTGHSSLLPGSLSSATSESAPGAEYRSEFGLLTPTSSPCSPLQGSVSSHPPRSRSTTDSDAQPSPLLVFPTTPSPRSSHRPSTAPHSPLLTRTTIDTVHTPAEHHTRSHSRLTTSIKNFLTKTSLPSPSRFSFNSSTSTTHADGEPSFGSFQAPWSMTPRKQPRPFNPEISGTVLSPSRDSNPSIDAHRRYASEAVSKIYNSRFGGGCQMSQESLGLLAYNAPPVLARRRESKTRNVLRRRPSGSAKLSKAGERGMSSPSPPHTIDTDLPPKQGSFHIPFSLTPAGAVVEAYKQQEHRCDDTPGRAKLSIDDRMSPRPSHDDGCHRVHPAHSSTSSDVHAGGSDDPWPRFEADQFIKNTSQATPSHHPSASDPSTRGLTRRVSSKWRKGRGWGVLSEDLSPRDRGHSKGRPSLQEMWGNDKSGTRSTGLSMDSVSNTAGVAWPSHMRSGSEKDGGKIWRLMRRISTGGLRDRIQADKVVPPVPNIPKELLGKVNQDERSDEPASMPRHHPSASQQEKDHILPPKNICVTRPSVAIASSSSNSSDLASTQFFYKTHSARSSVSSYGEAVATSRVPEIPLDQHIIAPLEQLRLGEDHVGRSEPRASSVPVPRSPRRSASVPIGLRTAEDAEGEHVSLPSPRRQTCSGGSPSSPSMRLSSTSGSARVLYQAQSHGAGAQIVDGIVSLSPPPRPPRNSRRGGSTASSPSHSMSVKQVDSSVGIGIGGARQIDRTPSTQSDTTARAESPESRRSQDTSPHTRTGFTFRELGAPRRPPLSEREKMDIWNDLLDRSDKAGGTLHINGAAELMSDSMRFSTHSGI